MLNQETVKEQQVLQEQLQPTPNKDKVQWVVVLAMENQQGLMLLSHRQALVQGQLLIQEILTLQVQSI